VEPEVGVHTSSAFVSQLSISRFVNVTTLPDGPAHSARMLVEQTRTGGVVSISVTVWLHREELVHESVTRHVRVAL
jgi:hypothetical protein